MNTAFDIGKQVFDKYNQLVVQPNSLVNPSVYTFTKDQFLFVVESGGAGLMGHSHELYEVQHEDPQAIVSFKMAKTYLHDHDATYFIAKNNNCYSIHCTKNNKLINASCETLFHSHSLKIREIFKDSVRIFSDYRDIQVISNKKYTFEIQIDEGVLLEHIHNIHQVPVPNGKRYRNTEIAFILKQNLFHGHEGLFYIEKDNDGFVIKCNKRVVNTTTSDDKIGKHEHNIKLVRVTKRENNKNVLLEDPVPNHIAHEIYHGARLLMQLA
jgi:hypothetical protein